MGEPFRYRELGYAALTVADLERSISFYRDLIGLELTGRTDGMAFMRCSSDHHNLVLYQGADPGLRRVAFELESRLEVDKAYRHFESRGLQPVEVECEECKALNQGRTFRVKEPASGLTFEFYAEVIQMIRPFTSSLDENRKTWPCSYWRKLV
ncbi:VOC family protein [Cupriavidus basilensis]|nr:VOC family protein [Cupriavidus basilensis]